MPITIPDLSEPIWTSRLVARLERAAAAIGRLDARVSASPAAAPWQRRATWTGYTTALRVQGAEIDEIDIFGRECAVNLPGRRPMPTRSEEHTSELQSLMRISYAVFCLKKKKTTAHNN